MRMPILGIGNYINIYPLIILLSISYFKTTFHARFAQAKANSFFTKHSKMKAYKVLDIFKV